MRKQHVAEFADGPVDGAKVPLTDFPEKVVIQLTNGRVYRYECDVTGETKDIDRASYGRDEIAGRVRRRIV